MASAADPAGTVQAALQGLEDLVGEAGRLEFRELGEPVVFKNIYFPRLNTLQLEKSRI
jgi:hypothetical protein